MATFTGQLGVAADYLEPGLAPAVGGSSFAGTATLSGTGTLSTSATVTMTGTAVLAGVGTLTTSATITLTGTAALTGTGTLSTSATVTVSGGASFSGTGTLAGTGSVSAAYFGSASLTGAGILSASGIRPLSFTPPTYTERPVTGERLTETRLKIIRGVSVLKNQDGSYTSITYPTTDDFANSLLVYQGGHVYPVSDAEAALLTTAGYGSNIA